MCQYRFNFVSVISVLIKNLYCFRYITVLYYLNDVEAGGETVFPLADMPDKLFEVGKTYIWGIVNMIL